MSLKLRSLFVFLFLANLLSAQPAYFVYPENIPHINDMAHHGDTLWLATDSGIVKLNTITNTQQFFQGHFQGKKNKFNRIIFENGNLWAASDTNGLWQFTNGNWTNFNTQNGLPNNKILDLTHTKDGTLWIATANGLAAKTGSNFAPHLPFQDQHISALASYGDSLVAGNHSGTEAPKLYTNGSWTALPTSNAVGDNIQRLFIDIDGNIYKISSFGFHQLNGTTWANPITTNYYGGILSHNGDFPIIVDKAKTDGHVKDSLGWRALPDFLETGAFTSIVKVSSIYTSGKRSFWCAFTNEDQLILAHYFDLPFETVTKKLDINSLSANFWPDGTLFNGTDEQPGNLFTPLTYRNKTIIYSSFSLLTAWSGARSNRLTTFNTYRSNAKPTFMPGPISNQYQQASFYEKYYQVWHITQQDIKTFLANYQNSNYIVPTDILTWPGNGDVAQGEPAIIAPFIDQNQNGIYEPALGDYPDIMGDEAVFFVYNTANGYPTFGSQNINAEFHTMAYAFDSAGTPAHNAIFVNQKIRFPNQNFDTLIIGQMTDYQIGYGFDDFYGCDSALNISFGYNADAIDEPNWGGFGFNAPAVGHISLNHPLHGFVTDNQSPFSVHFNELEVFNTLTSHWSDGSPIRIDNPSGIWNNQNGNGHNSSPSSPVTKFQYNASVNWFQSDNTSFSTEKPHAMLQFTNITPGTELCLSSAYFVAQDSSWNDIESTIEKLFDNAEWLQTFYNNQNIGCLNSVIGIDENKMAKNWTVGPNPSQGIFELTALDNFKNTRFTVVNLMGQVVAENKIANETTHINLSHLPSGVYLLQVVDAANISFTERLVIVD